MTKREYIDGLLAIVDQFTRPEDYRRRLSGGGGCLLERMHPDLTAPNIYSPAIEVLGEAQAVWDASDWFADRFITHEQFRARIAALAEG